VKKRFLISMGLLLLVASPGWGQDMRAAVQRAEKDRKAAEEAAREAEQRILRDRKALLEEVNRLESLEKRLEADITRLQGSIEARRQEELELSEEWSKQELRFRETIGTVRVSARDLESILKHSPLTAYAPERIEQLQPLLNKQYFPGIDDINQLTNLFLDEAKRSGEVSLKTGRFIDRAGELREGTILNIGKFTAIYETGDEVGFLNYSEDTHRFFALSALPSWVVQRNLKRYLQGEIDTVYTDLSGGAALRQITHKPTLWEQVQAGGPIVWPILAIAVLALFLILERIIYLKRVHGNTDRLMDRINQTAEKGDWAGCEEMIAKYEGRNWPVINVLTAGLAGRGEDRETQENILQEAILREAPRLERFLAVLGILGAIAPLLGLLGTVTGMIGTFRVITLYGTGDPRMMSGGISEALVTTELGLAVAIPIMLVHTFLSRRVDHIIGDMEEKAVALTNISQKARRQNGPSLQNA
jgi:biopolymer transport protein ExbB